MYCAPCGTERLGGAKFCVLCGSGLAARSKDALQLELEHVLWVLAEEPRWSVHHVGPNSRNYLKKLYRKRKELLERTLFEEHPELGRAAMQSNAAETAGAEVRKPPPAPGARPVPPDAPPPPGAKPPPQDFWTFKPEADPHGFGKSDDAAPASASASADADAEVSAAPLPEALFENPPEEERPAKDRLVEEASSWSTFWKPFLTESVGWFIGAFLILAGTFYFVADAWAGMTSTTRALVVFAIAAGWTLGFAAWARFLSRRSATQSAARVLALIGAAVSPLAAVAAGPALGGLPWLSAPGALPLSGLVAAGLIIGWAFVAAALTRGVALQWAPETARPVALSMVATATVMGLAPWLTTWLGPLTPWLTALPALLAVLAARAHGRAKWPSQTDEELGDSGMGSDPATRAAETNAKATSAAGSANATSAAGSANATSAAAPNANAAAANPGESSRYAPDGLSPAMAAAAKTTASISSAIGAAPALSFAFLAPLFLALLFAIRLAVSLRAASLPVGFGTWAPFLAAIGLAAAQLESERRRVPTALKVLVAAAQAVLLAISATGDAPAFFLTAALGAFTAYRFASAPQPHAARWTAGVYAFGYFAYQSCGQLIPGVLTKLLAQVKAGLGYGAEHELPVAWDAVYAAAYVIAGAVLVARWRKHDGRRAEAASILQRCTWVTALLIAVLAMSSLPGDLRPAVISLVILGALGVVAGLALDLPSWTRTASGLLAAWGFVLAIHGHDVSLPVAGAALVLALTSLPAWKGHRAALSLGAAFLSLLAVELAWSGPAEAEQIAALALASVAGLLVARNLDSEAAQRLAWFIPLSIPARVTLWLAGDFAPLVFAAGALLLALFALSQPKLSRARFAGLAASAGSALAVAWQWGLQVDHHQQPVLLGATLAVAFLTWLAVSRREDAQAVSFLETVASLFGVAALGTLPAPFETWKGAPIALGTALLAALQLSLSVHAARSERSRVTVVTSSFALVATLMHVLAAFVVYDHEPSKWALVLQLAALGTLLSTRVLLPGLTFPVAGALFAGSCWHRPELLGFGAAAFALFALFEEHDATWNHVCGKKRAGAAGALTSLGLLLPWLVFDRTSAPILFPLAAGLLPALWTRASRSSFFAALWVPLIALGTAHLDAADPFLWAAVCFVALSRGFTVAKVQRALGFEPKHAAGFSTALFFGAALLAVGESWLFQRGASVWVLALLLAGGAPLAGRFIAAALVSLAVPGLPLAVSVVLLALAFALHHLPRPLHALLGVRSPELASETATVAALVTAAWNVWTRFDARPSLHVGTSARAWSGLELAWPQLGNDAALLWLALVCVAAAVLLNFRWLLGAAVVALTVPLEPSLSHDGLRFSDDWLPEHHTRVAWLAFFSSALAVWLRRAGVGDAVERFAARAGKGLTGGAALPVWVATLLVMLEALAFGHGYDTQWPLLGAAVLLCFVEEPLEALLSIPLLVLSVRVFLPWPYVAPVLAGSGLLSALAATVLPSRSLNARPVWFHASWVLALIALALSPGLREFGTPVAGALGAATLWVLHRDERRLEAIAWISTLVSLHLLLFFAGLKLSTGAPRELILPWCASASFALAAFVLWRERQIENPTQVAVARGFVVFGYLELFAGLLLLPHAEPRECAVALVGSLLAGALMLRRALEEDDPFETALALVMPAAWFLTLRGLGFGLRPDAVEAFAALVFGAVCGGLSGWLEQSGREHSARVARLAALLWPLAGLLVAPWRDTWVLSVLLIAQSAHFANVVRGGRSRRPAAILSALAFNGAMVALALGVGLRQPEYLGLPFGLSLLLLVRVFKEDLSTTAQVKLRAVAVTVLYASAAIRPLTFDAPWALWVAVVVCVLGVGIGVALRVRSYVYLGTAFLVTSVLANLVRFGVREPRIGALLLSALGLLVVGFMVLMSTRRAELLERYKKTRSLLEEWEG